MCLIASLYTNQIAMIGLPPACSWGPPCPMMERTKFSQKIHSSFLFSLHTQFVWHKHAAANLFTDFEFQLQRIWLVGGWKGRRGGTLKVTSDIIGRSTKNWKKYFLRKVDKKRQTWWMLAVTSDNIEAAASLRRQESQMMFVWQWRDILGGELKRSPLSQG